MSFPKYPKYKDSGVEWLGDVPEHWEVRRIGSLFRQVDQPGTGDRQILSVSIHHGVSDSELDADELDRKVTRSDDRSKYKQVEPQDLVYNMMRAWQGGFGAVTVSGMVSPAYVVARPIADFSTPFVEQLLRTPQAVEQMRRHSQGVTDFRLRLYWDEFKSMRVVLPTASEQAAIAEFLDRETSKIDSLVAEQRRLIELLKEKRQAVISHAVTKGLNPHAPMKPSGIEWLGDVPGHWETKRIKHLASRISSGKTPLGGSEVYVDQGVIFLRSQNVYDEGLRLDDVVFISADVDEAMAVSRVDSNDILLNITGASIGRSCVVPWGFPAANVNQHVCVIRLHRPTHVAFVGWLFKSATIKHQIDYAQNGAAREGLNFAQIGQLEITLPPENEQSHIAEFLDSETSKFDKLTAEAERAIDLLQERRTALISATVTGRIDVRGLA